MENYDTLPVTLAFEGGRKVYGAVTREGGGRWRMVCAAYPSHVATGTNIVKVRQDLEKRLAPLVAADAAREAKREAAMPIRRRRHENHAAALERMHNAYDEARWLLT